MRLAILDQVPILTAGAPAEQQSVQLARTAEVLGYSRYWLAEHHGPRSGCGSPEVLAAAVASATTDIRVGTAAVLLPYYAPLKVATTFNLLSRLFPGRIDLGVGRGPGADPMTAALLSSPSSTPDRDYETNVAELLNHLDPSDSAPTLLPPAPRPQTWMMAAGPGGAMTAARNGMALCIAQFVHSTPRVDLVRLYREHFTPRRPEDEPATSVCAMVATADAPTDADAIAGFTRWAATAPPEAPTPSWTDLAEAGAPLRTPAGDLSLITGPYLDVAEQLTRLAKAYEVEEVVLATTCPLYALRERTFDLLSGALL